MSICVIHEVVKVVVRYFYSSVKLKETPSSFIPPARHPSVIHRPWRPSIIMTSVCSFVLVTSCHSINRIRAIAIPSLVLDLDKTSLTTKEIIGTSNPSVVEADCSHQHTGCRRYTCSAQGRNQLELSFSFASAPYPSLIASPSCCHGASAAHRLEL